MSGLGASASDKGDLVLTAADGSQEAFPIGKIGVPERLRFSKDMSRLAVGYANGTILVWDVSGRRQLVKWNKPRYTRLHSLDFSPDGMLLLALLDCELFVLDFRIGAKGRIIPRAKLNPGMLRCASLSPSDHRMDQKGFSTPLNALPEKCPVCHFSDLDYVPEPYVLGRGLDSPAGIAGAEVGNLLVRSNVRKILEQVAPGQCTYYATRKARTGEATDWFLAVPVNFVETGAVKESVRRCSHCGEPAHAHGTQFAKGMESSLVSPFDICKSRIWISTAEKPVKDLKGWVDKRDALHLFRDSYFSQRLILLLKKLGIRGPHQYTASKDEPSPEDHQWVRQQLLAVESLTQQGTALPGEWLQEYLSKQKRKEKTFHFADIEREHSVQLPEDYKKYVCKMGTKVFRNVDGEEGCNVRVLLPEDLNFKMFQGRIKDDPDEERGEDGIVFAATEFGDFFCFKTIGEPNQWEVYRYDHEMDDFEPYAIDFEACIRAWSAK